ncbi:PaaX family transcriptional regulator C-terminal domain-containing protein [Solwaraspora sp. WMMD406]|uniref:PaaX family transcriptional regulator n=1 Tax=Solwaraspora sp. WMMD406 TaxID=3016095 RepID=UPI002417DA55|nr:PaaX family transcriptional regulator C-terminal domain-containing protein [Solwaraspora sp. WMMD406]MDG4765933.1 PaaX family transcriptional regulator C-terminal domain-containing protein [Solwaraspora sp. WMMD406]
MPHPFTIEEIYPDDEENAVRLPRRQNGNSPQGLAVTLLADYTLRSRASVPSAAIVALLAEADVSPTGARTAISRLARRGILDGSRHGRNSSYRLSQQAAHSLSVGGSWIVASTATTPSWDERWTLIAFSLPQERSAQRRALRGRLRWLGYAPLYDGLWISPYELAPLVRAHLTQLTLGTVTVFRGHRVEFDAISSRDPIDAWDIAAIGKQYEDFLQRWSPLLDRIRSGQVSGTEAVRARTEVMDTYRRFPTLDPQLPLSLLPAGWLREPARQVFAAVYDGLARIAEEHVKAVIARFDGNAQPGVQAHLTADLLAGVRNTTRSGTSPDGDDIPDTIGTATA